MMKLIGRLAIGILIVDVAVVTVSFMQQSSKLTQATANVSSLESQVTAQNGELVTLRGSVAALQSRLADSESKASAIQTQLNASQANVTGLQTALAVSNANYAKAPAGAVAVAAANVTLQGPTYNPPFDHGAGMGGQ